MPFRFLKVEWNEEYHDYNYDDAKYLCSVKHNDYVEFIKLLQFFKEQHNDNNIRNFGQLGLVSENEDGTKQWDSYSIVDIILEIPNSRSPYMESVEVYICED